MPDVKTFFAVECVGLRRNSGQHSSRGRMACDYGVREGWRFEGILILGYAGREEKKR